MMKLELQSLVSDPTLSDSRTTTTTAPTTTYHALILLYTTNRNPNPNPMPISNSHPKAMAADGPSERDQATPMTVAVVSKSNPGSTWADLETSHLIDVYEEKWNSSKRGPLRAKQWEDVAVEVAHRCGLNRPSKSGTQCRHKIEKLRKRYRSERLRPVHSLWPFFDRIDRMERGPLLISARPTPPAPASSSSCSDFKSPLSNKRSVNGILGEAVLRGSARGSGNARPAKRLADVEDAEDNDEDNEEEADEGGDGRGGGLTELAAELRRFGEGFVRMERKRIEMMREKEREWMEMESRRLEMVMEAQRGLVETIAGAFWKKTKNSEDL
ncbi:uncharacterized protein LOC110030771 [Phalaenopsis equestris]|uniref:uncharacterized protein LOC110030771 n=1 Tax=Phalaenopsis equestris TaxID=78828 RepID=UPI0009E4536B|nr:uncharacterized protein LOC110030771 [Phalaenopsis equestris]XP_020589339.1 uncharacterized protein LOC110030771 [Phalaenopsis equestris]